MNGLLPDIAAWSGFYVIVGSAAGALIGLQFIAMTLLAERPPKDAARLGAAFATPAVVHLCVVLLLAAGMNAPWPSIQGVGIVWGIMGFSGLVYSAIVARRMRGQSTYRPEFEDWLFHVGSPLAGYGMLAWSAFAAVWWTQQALFAVAAGALVLLFTGIHNAWDNASYHVLVKRAEATHREKE